MATSARRLLAAVDRLPFGARQRLLADTARELTGTAALDQLLHDLDDRDEFGRRLALHLAYMAGHRAFVERCLSAPQTGVVGLALVAAARLGSPAAVFLERLPHLSTSLRRTLYNAARRVTGLADVLLPEVRARYGDREAARLLAACSAPTVAIVLPEMEHAVTNWSALARRHPVVFFDFLDAELAATPTVWWAQVWDRFGSGLAAVAPTEPARVLDLLERVLPHAALPYGLGRGFGALARHSPRRVAALLVDPRRTWPIPARRSLWRALVTLDDTELGGIARVLDDAALVGFLHTLPPSRRAAVYAGERTDVPPAVLDELPAAARAAEARRLLGLRAVADDPARRLVITARLSWDEAGPALRTATRRATAEERAAAYPLYIGAAAATRDPAVFAEVITGLTRLANEQDPVRAQAITALAGVPSWLHRPSEAAVLVTLMVDAVQARDCSWLTQSAVRTLAAALIREGAVSLRPELVEAGARGMERLGAHTAWLDLSGLDRVLPRGAEHRVFDALRPRIAADAARGRYSVLLALAAGLGRRAWTMPRLQDLLGAACRAKDDGVVSRAVGLWLAPSATRDERVARVLADDLSTITLSPVLRAVGFRRTDLVDKVVGKRVRGRFLDGRVRYIPPFEGCFRRWLPRQVTAYAGELTALAASSAQVYERAHAVRSLGRVPGTAGDVRRFLADREVEVVEAALSALAWTDEPGDVLPDLLAHADTDRARVAVYAAARCARFTAPDRLAGLLRPVLAGRKVTARKEAVRLLAEHHAALDLAGTWDGAHRDVRRALVSATRWCLDDEAAWDLLAKAVTDEHAVALAVLDQSPLTVAVRHRARYAALVRAVASRPDPDTAGPALAVLSQWRRWDSAGSDLLVDLVSDVDNTAAWRPAVAALIGSAHAADFAPIRAAVARLLTVADRFDAAADRDLPARQRITALAAAVARDQNLRSAASALAGDLAADVTFRRQAILLAVAAIPWDSDALDRLRAVARLADRPDLARHAADEVGRHLGPVLRRVSGVHEIAVALAGDGAAGARLTLAITMAAGPDTGWPEHWRTLLRTLRRHDDPDVRAAALASFTSAE